jgi:hypothetical protein
MDACTLVSRPMIGRHYRSHQRALRLADPSCVRLTCGVHDVRPEYSTTCAEFGAHFRVWQPDPVLALRRQTRQNDKPMADSCADVLRGVYSIQQVSNSTMLYHAVVTDTGFRLEKDLVTALRDRSSAVLRSANVAGAAHQILSEQQVGMCIPDLLVVRSKPAEDRTPLRLSYFDCALIATALKSGTVTVADLAASTYSAPEQIGKRVVRLVKLGLMSQRSDRLRVPAKTVPSGAHVVAVEAKLTRWRDALAQAQDYLRFANEAYIAMPASVIGRNATALAACADAGVGVIAVDEVDARVVLRAQSHRPYSAEWVRIVTSSVGLRQLNTAAKASRQAR